MPKQSNTTIGKLLYELGDYILGKTRWQGFDWTSMSPIEAIKINSG
ncbi:hypothetical protein HYV31_00150 [candidate division WWE3 bacterium]|nr:hypothetical protein [candidate division WWE3 bacterium]